MYGSFVLLPVLHSGKSINKPLYNPEKAIAKLLFFFELSRVFLTKNDHLRINI
jgi:hypothetical protein